jgi:F-box and leucine-rich repeat protein 2/20
MELPAFLPEKLNYTANAESARALYEKLSSNASDFVLFFESAANDETWSERHSAFMQLALHWFTNQFFDDKLSSDSAKQVARSVQAHDSIIGSWVPVNLTICLKETEIPANSLLWGTSSEWMRQRIRQECRDKNQMTLAFKEVSYPVFEQIDEFIRTGQVKNLWRKEQTEIVEVLRQADEWGLALLVQNCEEILSRYIDDSNVIDQLIQSHEEQWPLLRSSCIDLINQREVGVRFEHSPIEELAFVFMDFRDSAMEIFERVRFLITHLSCGHHLVNDPLFTEVVNRCPLLSCLSISESEMYSERLLDIPGNLEGLDLSKCGWLNHKNLRLILENCPQLISLSLASNSQLNYTAWGLLKLLKNLIKLNISNCHQVNDQDLRVILQACREVTHFDLSRCAGLSDLSFYELAKHVPRLTDLNLSRCNIYDGGLIDIATRCQKLIALNINRCTTLSDKGVVESIRNAPNLQMLNVSGCGFSETLLQKIKQIRPYLLVVS